MARNSKNKKIARKNKKLRYRKGGPARLDMRKGGRVALQGGGFNGGGLSGLSRGEDEYEESYGGDDDNQDNQDNQDQSTYTPPPVTEETPEEKAAREAADLEATEAAAAETRRKAMLTRLSAEADPTIGGGQVLDPIERQERIKRTTETIEGAAEGEVPDAARITKQDKLADISGLQTTDEQLQQISDQKLGVTTTGRKEAVGAAQPTATKGKVHDDVTFEDVKDRDGWSAALAEAIDNPLAASKQLNPKAIASLESAVLTKEATGITIDEERALTTLQERVTGALDPEAKAIAAEVAGTSLPRILRAKKQIRKAGLSEEDINNFANDPNLLEDKLTEYTEAERGMVAGLPEEALVNVQLNSLLEGMESGEIPVFAKPAVAAINQLMAERGLDVSTVGRDNLFNAIIQAAVPLAQQNAQTIKESVFQQRGIEAQAEIQNAQMRQQTALSNADKTFNLNMAQFNADQQKEVANSKFLQTVTLTDATHDQQATMQNAAARAQLDIANLSTQERLATQNAQAFLQMDLANLSNEQQANILKSQQDQQAMLTDVASKNAAKQFNAASELQLDQFNANLSAQIDLNNAQRNDAMEQFNAQQVNAAGARDADRSADVSKFNAQMFSQIDQFNSQQEFNRRQWNSSNAQAIQQADLQWRRQANQVDTAMSNQINQVNAQNAFNMSAQAQTFLWQELRDQADFDFKAMDNEYQRQASLMIAALGNDGLSYKGRNWKENIESAANILKNFTFGYG